VLHLRQCCAADLRSLSDLSELFSGSGDHLTRYSVILDMSIAVSEASALSFPFLTRHRFAASGFHQLCQLLTHNRLLATAIFALHSFIVNEYAMSGFIFCSGLQGISYPHTDLFS
jgi:hypothetical protein